MTLAITYSRASIGIEAPLVTVETHLTNGLPRFNIVGLPETVVKESKDRVRSAIINSHFEFPSRRITVNLAPADLPKYGGRYDLAIALGILSASRQLTCDLSEFEFAGELALSGELRPVPGMLSFALSSFKNNQILFVPLDCLEEAGLISGIQLIGACTLLEVCAHLLGRKLLPFYTTKEKVNLTPPKTDLMHVKGQHHAKRALEIAAAGQHSLLLIGPPGVGKTMLSHCLNGILPELKEEEAVELAAIRSISGQKFDIENWRLRPFRAPHHSCSHYALIGGGNPPKPGEISLAHQGILFLDELPEFKRQALEALREPLESGRIEISRASHQASFPAKFQLIAAMNPCPCGYYGSKQKECICSTEIVKKYQAKISGPLLDRIDVQTELQLLDSFIFNDEIKEEESRVVQLRVLAAREIQVQRQGKPNALLTTADLNDYCRLTEKQQSLMEDLLNRFKLSVRSFHKILKIARTLADLEQAAPLADHHLKEALSFRSLERMKIR